MSSRVKASIIGGCFSLIAIIVTYFLEQKEPISISQVTEKRETKQSSIVINGTFNGNINQNSGDVLIRR